MIKIVRAAIFDLDGVIVDTARYHYLAWKRLAKENGFDFTEADNERLKGVSRMASLEILLEIGGLVRTAAEKEELAARKNLRYRELIDALTPADVLPGALALAERLRSAGARLALASASRNALTIVERLALGRLFECIVDGHQVTRAKPDPEIFLRAAAGLRLPAAACVVFEDAAAGVAAAHAAGMRCVAVGDAGVLGQADWVVPSLARFDPNLILT
jgi:beta-phosphoglucomutase